MDVDAAEGQPVGEDGLLFRDGWLLGVSLLAMASQLCSTAPLGALYSYLLHPGCAGQVCVLSGGEHAGLGLLAILLEEPLAAMAGAPCRKACWG